MYSKGRKKPSTEHSTTQQAQQAEQSTSTPGETILDARAPGWVAAEVESPVESRGSVDGVLQKLKLAGAPARLGSPGKFHRVKSSQLSQVSRVNRPSQVDPLDPGSKSREQTPEIKASTAHRRAYRLSIPMSHEQTSLQTNYKRSKWLSNAYVRIDLI